MTLDPFCSLALLSASSCSACDVSEARFPGRGMPWAAPGAMRRHRAVPRRGLEGNEGAVAWPMQRGEPGREAARSRASPSPWMTSAAVLPASRPLSLRPAAWRPSASLPCPATSSFSTFSSSSSPASSVSGGKGCSLLLGSASPA